MKKGREAVILLSLLLWGSLVLAQSQLDMQVTLRLQNATIERALLELIQKYEIRFSFSNDLLPNKSVTAYYKKQPLRSVLNALLADTDLAYREIGGQIVIFVQEKPKTERKFTISGFVQDAASGERLVAASILDRRSGKGAATNEYGFFSLTLPEGEARIGVHYLGYIPQEYVIKLNSDKRLTVELSASLLLPEVTVIARDSLWSKTLPGFEGNYFNPDNIKMLPGLGGESDLLRAIHLLPGVQTGTDGIGGIHVRGGNPEHNLILVDGVPVYNPLHAAGLFSIFNTEAIRSAQLIKGNFSARYGGRLSSVLDVHTKEGNMNRLSGQAEVGLLTTRASLEGPLVKEKSSFFVSARQSLLNWYLSPVSKRMKEDQGGDGEALYDFFDINAKLNYILSPKDRVYLSFYRGNDDFRNRTFKSDSFIFYSNRWEDTLRIRRDNSYREQLSWGNTIASARWNRVFGSKLFSNLTLTYSRFATDVIYSDVDSLILQNRDSTLLRSFDRGRFRSSIEDFGGKADFDWLITPNQTLRFGLGVTAHGFRPGVLTLRGSNDLQNVDDFKGIAPIHSLESYLYAENNFRIGSQLMFNLGAHAARLTVQGKTYNSFQPRLAAYWRPLKRLGLQAAYGEMTQFVHLLSNSNIGLPTDLWAPATSSVPPQQAWQTSLGVDYDLKGWSFSVEGYYKEMTNLLSYTEGAFFLNDWEQNVTTGSGRAYGIETFLQKSKGKTTGWLAYTLSWADRQFELVNLGQRYPFKFDRRHDFKIVVQHHYNKWINLSANWIVSSGFAFSLPIATYFFETSGGNAVPVIDYGTKNQFRMPLYHRLDVNASFSFKARHFMHGLNVGLYNVYNRRNPLYYDLRTDFVSENGELKEKKSFVQVWLLPLLPAVNYSVKF